MVSQSSLQIPPPPSLSSNRPACLQWAVNDRDEEEQDILCEASGSLSVVGTQTDIVEENIHEGRKKQFRSIATLTDDLVNITTLINDHLYCPAVEHFGHPDNKSVPRTSTPQHTQEVSFEQSCSEVEEDEVPFEDHDEDFFFSSDDSASCSDAEEEEEEDTNCNEHRKSIVSNKQNFVNVIFYVSLGGLWQMPRRTTSFVQQWFWGDSKNTLCGWP